MVILDTNIFIYLANGTLDRLLVSNLDIAHASVVRIEALGYTQLPVNELLLLVALFEASYNVPLSDAIVERAIKLRQARRMALGDAIVAATALENDCELWTANTDDFKHVDGLKLYDPVRASL